MHRTAHTLTSILAVAPLALLSACGGNVAANGKADSDAGTDVNIPVIVLPEAGVHQKPPAVDAGVDTGTPPLGLTAVALNVCVPNEYTAAVTVGTQTFEMAIDTGSTTLGVASTACPTCGVTPEYSPGATAADQHATGMSQYGTGSWSGEIYQDTVGVGDGATAPVDFVAIDSQSQFFQPGTMCNSKIAGMQGILGFGPAASALTGTNAFFDQLVTTHDVPDIFATELCDTSGTLWLGGYDPTFTTAAPQYTPLSQGILSSYYYAVNLVSITVAGTVVPVATTEYADSVVDTGTSVFIMPTSTFDALTQAIAATPAYQAIFGTSSPGDGGTVDSSWFSSPENCSMLTGETKETLDAKLPPLTLTFGSNPAIEVQALPTESYMMTYDGYWCPTLYPTDPGPDFPLASIIGSPVLRSNVVIFDRANGRVGFAPHTTCK